MVGCSADSCEGATAAAVAVAAMRSILIVACALSPRAVAFAPPRSALSPRAFAPRSSVRPLRRSVAMAAREHRTAAVVGGGPAGLLSAIALARRGWAVDVFERGAAPPASSDACWGAGERSYQLGLNGRGQKALRRFGVMDRVDARAASVRGRLSIGADGNLTETRLTPPGEPGAEKSYVTRVMQRDRLQACLLEAVGDYERVAVHFGVACDGVGLGDRPTLSLDPPRERTWDLVVGADGVNSHVRAALEGAPGSTTRCVRFENRNERRYRTIPLHPSRVPGTPTDLNWGFRNASAGLGMDALPTLEGEMVAVLLFKPDSPVSRRLAALETADDARAFFDDVAPRAAKESEIPNFKGSYLGRCPLVSADFWTSDHLSERSRSVGAISGTRARGTLTLKRR